MIRIAETMDAHHVFGFSSGALIVLRAAQLQPSLIRSIALYEPPLATPGYEQAFDWTDEVAQMLDAGQKTAALTRMIAVVGDHWAVRLLPRAVLRAAATVALRWVRGENGDRLADLLPTFRQDARIVRDARTLLPSAATVTAETLLMKGDRAAEPLRAALDALHRELSHNAPLTLNGIGHLAATNSGKPELIASHLRTFFSRA